MDVFSLVVNVVAIVGAAIKLLGFLHRASERQNDLPKLLNSHRKEIQNTEQITDIVLNEDELHIDTIVTELNAIGYYGSTLKDYLVDMAKDRNAFQQYARQLIRGPKDNAKLNDIMLDLHHAKESLMLKIQAAHVGLMRPASTEKTSRSVEDNETSDSAIMINAPIGQREVTDLTIRRNTAKGHSIMINHRTPMKHIERLIAISDNRVAFSDQRTGSSTGFDGGTGGVRKREISGR